MLNCTMTAHQPFLSFIYFFSYGILFQTSSFLVYIYIYLFIFTTILCLEHHLHIKMETCVDVCESIFLLYTCVWTDLSKGFHRRSFERCIYVGFDHAEVTLCSCQGVDILFLTCASGYELPYHVVIVFSNGFHQVFHQ